MGDGPERDALSQQAKTLGISDTVVFAGFQRDMAPYFAMARILALPSHSEGSPNVVLEAMAAGLPIAATNVGGVPEILEDGKTGLLLPAGDPAAMAAAIRQLMTDAELGQYLGQSVLAEVRRGYTLESYRHKLVSFYQDTLQDAEQR